MQFLREGLEHVGFPEATTIEALAAALPRNADMDHLRTLLTARHWRSRLRKWFEGCGYFFQPNPNASDQLWRVGGKRCAVYARIDMAPDQRLAAAEALVSPAPKLGAALPPAAIAVQLTDKAMPADRDALRGYLTECLAVFNASRGHDVAKL